MEPAEFDLSEDPALAPTVDFGLIADAVQASGGKLFVLGGGWDTLTVRAFPARHHTLALGLRIVVPWTYDGRTVRLEIDLQDEDGHSIFSSGPVRHQFKVRRPQTVADGESIGMVQAYTFNNVPFRAPGGYSFVVSLDDVERKRIRFRVRPVPERPKPS